MVFFGQEVKAKCKKCGKEAPVSDFRMHYDYRMMVCSNCFKPAATVINKPEAEKPAALKAPGWDKEDEYLEKAARMKNREQSVFKTVPGSGQTQCQCVHCKYSFKYNTEKNTPSSCPYCNQPVPKYNTHKF